LYRLKNSGQEAYLVGGAVRDLLLGIIPKDFDIATNAYPEKIKILFRNCILIGRRFRLAHIRFGHEVIEVATFRAAVAPQEAERQHSEHGMIVRDNVYGTMEEDAWRRDFTINALYYNIKDFSVVDYVGGMKDIKNKTIRMIGDPVVRYHEDPVRMLRAIRIAAKLGFTIAKETGKPIMALTGLLQNVPAARLFDEISKWFNSGKSLETFNLLRQYGLFAVLFPQTEAGLASANSQVHTIFVSAGFRNTDKRIAEGRPINPAFLYSVLLWWPFKKQLEYLEAEEELPFFDAMLQAMQQVLRQQAEHISLPHYLRIIIKEIWILQYRLEQRHPKKIALVLRNPKFRAAYDFLLLRAEAGEKISEIAAWWTEKQDAGSSRDIRH
jgi:poly(A) polymerase